jgi:iron complex transport system ATP-binding protein
VSAVELEDVSVRLGGATIVAGFSAAVDGGAWVALIGPNGAGKTTVLRAVCGLVGFSGSITITKTPVRGLDRRRLSQRVALVPQAPMLPLELTVAEYVLLGRTAYVRRFGGERAADREAVARAMEQLDLLALSTRELRSLSGGERQRAVLARALAQEAPLLLLDEPTSALDVGRQQLVLELVERLRAERGLTVLAAMHDLTLAAQYAERLLLVDRGRLIADGPPRLVLSPALIERHYRATVRVLDVDGAPVVIPARSREIA